jgi:hypothetical protein
LDSLPDWAPRDVDLTTPSAARMYDYFLGGAHNFGVDRELAHKVMEISPRTPMVAQANRAFLHRAVRYLGSQGIRQFIDIGSGIPTAGNVHETAQGVDPTSRVLYVDHDPVAVVHSELILGESASVRVLQSDLRRPDEILAATQSGGFIDLSLPVAVLMVAVLHFVSEDERPDEAIRQFHEAAAPGSYLVISHGFGEGREADTMRLKDLYKSTADQITYRSLGGIEGLFDGWGLVDPGLVWVPEWRPDWPDDVGADPSSSGFVGGVGRKA